jgi:integrase
VDKLKLTQAAVTAVPLIPAPKSKKDRRQRVYRFEQPPGLLLVVGTHKKTFAFQSDAGGTSRRKALGAFGEWTVDDARTAALQEAARVARGHAVAPNPRRTLRDAMEAYLADRSQLADKTKRYTRSLFTLYLADWMDKPLPSITTKMVLQRHAAIAKRIKDKPRYENSTYDGRATANDVARKLRVVWSHAGALDDSFPPNPVQKLTTAGMLHPDKMNKRADHVPLDQLKDWWGRALEFKEINAVHFTYLALVLFTGMRREEAAALRWSEYHPKKGTLTLAPERTKNRRGQTVYLSLQAQDILESMEMLRNSTEKEKRSDYVFPAGSVSGHVEEPRWGLAWIAERTGIEVTVHGLRRTFVTVAELCPISAIRVKQLVGHAPSSVTEDYVMQDPGGLRAAAAMVGERMQKLCLGQEKVF